jgi:ATP-dependent DNA helicase RecG
VESIVNQSVDVPIELLNTYWWTEYSKKRGLTRPLPDALKHLGLSIKDSGKKWKPTIAAVLLFAEEPNGLLDKKCSIRIFHYKGHNVEYSSNPNLVREPITITGPILKQIRDAVEAVSRELDSGVHRTNLGFEFKQEYPMKVVQEAITNAVLHRDYFLSGDIQVRIFTNRIEIESPGLFPGAISAENIGLIGSKPRNPKLTDHIREFPNPPNLDAGEGVRMMQMTMKEQGLYPPIFRECLDENKNTILVKISNEAKLSEWELVHEYLSEHNSINNKELREILNLSSSESPKASRFFKDWVDTGLLQIANPQKGTRSRYYVLTSKSKLLADILANNDNNKRMPLTNNTLDKLLLAIEGIKKD